MPRRGLTAHMSERFTPSQIRYMLYLSERKINMAYAQIPRSTLQRLTPDRVSVATPWGTVGMFKNTAPLTVYERLAAVITHLTREGDVGTVPEPKAYFSGRLYLRSNLLPSPDGDEEMVCYAGVAKTLPQITVLVLVGSASNTIGANGQVAGDGVQGDYAFKAGFSFDMPAVNRAVKEVLESRFVMQGISAKYEAIFSSDSQPLIDKEVVRLIDVAQQLDGFGQTCEFFAKRLFEGEVDYYFGRRGRVRAHLIVGSPFYVALGE